ncbi:CCA tRNA nucleotidyltransferase [Crateriforma spongiae]|uniref:CCA tRNA nucleotidyltransferase n=1 Tax=Crateriforma spongiae TaxID=2724528 RepID=UPI001F297196|nr:CCA tRNA nucleotidyltransferase [Crateriforma spongiae]
MTDPASKNAPSTLALPLDCPRAAEAIRIIRTLDEHGFVAYLAGGCVRDLLLGIRPKDYDVATDATPPMVRKVFGRNRTLAFGASFGVIGVLPGHRKDESDPPSTGAVPREPTEVATFRSDGSYSDGRRPDSVHYGNAPADAARRDFTINGLFYDPKTRQVIDYVDGQADLRRRRLRTIGDPEQRFAEDRLRMLRAVRFATTLGFDVDASTMDAVRLHAGEVGDVSAERIGAEMRKTLASDRAAMGLDLLIDSGLATKVWPELPAARSDRWRQRLASIERGPDDLPSALSPFVVALAVTVTTFDDPDAVLQRLKDRWRLSTEEIRATTTALKDHSMLAKSADAAWSDLQPCLVDRDIGTTLAVAAAVVRSDRTDRSGIRRCEDALRLPTAELDPPPLVTGKDLKKRGWTPGPHFKHWLTKIRRDQLDGRMKSRDDAEAWLETQHREQGDLDADGRASKEG